MRYGLLIVLLLALALRLVGLGWGLPHVDLHPDEPILQDRAAGLGLDDLDPDFYIYPSLYIYQQAVVRSAVVAAGGEPWQALYWGRLLTALYGWVTVLLLYLLGARLAGRRCGLLAAGLYAVLGPAILHAHYAVTDTPMTALATAACWLAVRAWQRDSVGGVLLAAAVAGLAVSTKYSALPVVYVPLLAAFALLARQRRSLPSSLLVSIAIPALATVFFFLGSPYTLLSSQAWFDDLETERQLQQSGRPGWHVDAIVEARWSDRGLVGNGRAMVEDLGPPLLLAALAGLTLAIAGFFRRPTASGPVSNQQPASQRPQASHDQQASYDQQASPGQRGSQRRARGMATDEVSGATTERTAGPPQRWDHVGWAMIAAWPLLYYLQMAPSALWGSRYVLPIYPALVLLAAGALELLFRRLPDRIAKLPGPVVAAAVAATVAIVPAWNGVRAMGLVTRTDTRLIARQWILDNLPAGSSIVREFYAPPLYSGDGFRLQHFFSLSEQSFELYCSRGVDYLLTSSRNYDRYFEDTTRRFEAQRGWYQSLPRNARLVKRFPGADAELHQPTIEVWRLFCPD